MHSIKFCQGPRSRFRWGKVEVPDVLHRRCDLIARNAWTFLVFISSEFKSFPRFIRISSLSHSRKENEGTPQTERKNWKMERNWRERNMEKWGGVFWLRGSLPPGCRSRPLKCASKKLFTSPLFPIFCQNFKLLLFLNRYL